MQANDNASIAGAPAFTLTFDALLKAYIDVTWPGAGATLTNDMETFDVRMEQTPQGTTLMVTININNKLRVS